MTELRKRILLMREAGSNYNEISSALGCSKSTVSYHLDESQKGKITARTRDSRGKKRKYLSELKARTSCMDCEVNYPAHIMDFDHVRGDKVANISEMLSLFSWEEILKEVEKCDIVCSNCHRERTWQRKIKSGAQAHDYIPV